MGYYSPSIEKLVESFEKLPSIGHKTAQRLAFYMLDLSDEEIKEFTDSIINAKKNLKYCSKCFNITDSSLLGFEQILHGSVSDILKHFEQKCKLFFAFSIEFVKSSASSNDKSSI